MRNEDGIEKAIEGIIAFIASLIITIAVIETIINLVAIIGG